MKAKKWPYPKSPCDGNRDRDKCDRVKRCTIIIPARLASTRLPNKPLADLGGKPLVVRVAEQAHKVDPAIEVIVAVDHPSTEHACNQHGIRTMFTGTDHTTGSDRIYEVAKQLDTQWILNIQGDEPFVNPKDLRSLLHTMIHKNCAMASLCTPIKTTHAYTNPNCVKVVMNAQNEALYFSRAAIPYHRESPLNLPQLAKHPQCVYKHLGIYGYRLETLAKFVSTPVNYLEETEKLEQLRALSLGIKIQMLVVESDAVGIDTPEDLADAQKRVKELGENAFPN